MSCRTTTAALTAVTALAPGAAGEFVGIDVVDTLVWLPDDGFAVVIRIDAVFTDPADQLVLVDGTPSDPLEIDIAVGPLYQHPGGGDTAPTPRMIDGDCAVGRDTFADIGTLVATGPPVTLLPGFPGFDASGLHLTRSGWLRLPSDPLTFAGPDLRVPFAQIVTLADPPLKRLSGRVNLTTIEDGATVAHVGETVFGSFLYDVPFCAGDVNRDFLVDVEDLVAVVLAWGPCIPCGAACPDTNGDFVIDVQDLVEVILQWGTPQESCAGR